VAGEDSDTLYSHRSEIDNGICVLGFVDNLVDYIMASDICIVPLISGGGTSLKMLEYMAAGKPIITTNVGCRGFPIVDGEHAVIRNELKNDFPEAIINILETPEDEWIGHQARDLAIKYDWEKIGQKLYTIYCNIN
jgi:glycosyltransferase involved in cell wall biosynthesis